jgi:hypothetical protein
VIGGTLVAATASGSSADLADSAVIDDEGAHVWSALVRLVAVAAIALLLALLVPSAYAVDFTGPTSYSTGANNLDPWNLAVGDFNQDSHPDLVVGSFSGPNISILLGAGDGSFGSATSITAGVSDTHAVAVGNFDSGTDPDLAVADSGNGTVSILLGGAGATFGSPTPYNVASNGYGMIGVGEFNGDSDPDLAIVGNSDVSILLGGAGGTFSAAPGSPFATDNDSRSVAAGNFDAGSNRDLALANFFADSVSILLGTGGGAFGSPTNLAANGGGPSSVVAKDFDGDSDPDLAIVDWYTGQVSIRQGGSGASFGAATDHQVGSNPYWVATGNFNLDTDPDLVVSNYFGDDVSILLGGAGVGFGAAQSFPAGATPVELVVADFDSDGDDDLAVSDYGGGSVSILLQVNTAGFARPKSASPLTIKLVPAFNQCTSGNGTHPSAYAPPSNPSSCAPPVQSSSYLTFNSPDRAAPYNTATNGSGSLVMKVYCTDSSAPPCPAAGDQQDVALNSTITDVRCVAVTGGCASAGGTYAGKVLFRTTLRITDKLNGPAQAEAGTVQDRVFEFGVQCSGGSCSSSTTANAVVPGLVKEQKRAIWRLSQVELRDGGSDGNLADAPSPPGPPGPGSCPPACTGNGGETVFLRQGLFAP